MNNTAPIIIPVSEDESVVTSATGDPTVNLSESSFNGGLYSGGDGGNYQSAARFYLKFNLPEPLANTEVISATLTGFYYDDFDENDDGTHGIYFVSSDSWSESTITFENQPGQAFGLPEATFDAAEANPGGFISWDLTPIVNQEYQGDGTLSLLFHAAQESVISDNRNFEYFVEKEYDSSKAFRLEITTAEADTNSLSQNLRYEAEQLDLSGYSVESVEQSGASGGQQISLKNTGFDSGSATGIFDGITGTYQVVVGYYDENDGISRATVTVAGESVDFEFDQDLPANWAQPIARTTRLTHSAINLESGDRFEISAQADGGEYARFDYLDFVPVDAAIAGSQSPGLLI